MCPRASASVKPPSPELPPWVQPHPQGAVLHIKVQPRASRGGIEGVLGQELKVRVTAPPVDSAANEALLELLAECLDCPKNAVAILRGQTARHKVVLVRGRTATQLGERIKALL